MEKGIITIALKHSLYGRFAYNLALSIKAADPAQNVCLIADAAAMQNLHAGHKMLFNEIIEPKLENIGTGESMKPLLSKFDLYELSPYTKATLFCDADMIFSPLCNFQKLWSELEGKQWTMANRGINYPDKGISEWVDPGKLKEAYDNVDQWYDLSSEWIYWEPGQISEAIFAKAKTFYNENKLLTRQFAGDKPDEPFFNLALNALSHKPHAAPYQPTYWQPAIKKVLNALEVKRQYYAFSAGGNHLPKNQKYIYDELLKNASYKMKMQGLQIQDKRLTLKERKLI